ncbi:MAG: ScnB-like protein [Pseudomonadota bacterium]
MVDQKKHNGRRWHDMGGLAAGDIDPASHDYALWEKRVDALLVLMTAKGHFTVDGLRRTLETMGPEAFETMTYYERWIASVTQNLIESGAFTIEELRAQMEQVQARGDTYGEASLDSGKEEADA